MHFINCVYYCSRDRILTTTLHRFYIIVTNFSNIRPLSLDFDICELFSNFNKIILISNISNVTLTPAPSQASSLSRYSSSLKF
ncbi:unnamed protein product [Rhizophagus irregularis]|nr:unnamed protein product [Rhizophagus irregularis]CAB5206649.1 unnamed protein product [Rhizophagus irregularis]